MKEGTNKPDSPQAARTGTDGAKPSIFSWTFTGFCILLAGYALLLAAYLLPQDYGRVDRGYLMLALAGFLVRTFLFHLGLAGLLLALVFAWTRRWRLLLLAVPLVGWALRPSVMAWLPKRPPPTSGPVLRVISTNLLTSNRKRSSLLNLIAEENPDLLVLQEFSPFWCGTLTSIFGQEYRYSRRESRNDSFGMAVFSREPFAGYPDVYYLGPAPVPQFRLRLNWAGREIVLYNVHLWPPVGLRGFARQRLQFADLLERIEKETTPVVLCGDFNFTDDSPFAEDLHRLGFTDAHVLAGRGRGATWPARGLMDWLPGIRLDHVYLSPELTAHFARVGPPIGSDHRPVLVGIGLRAR